MDEVLQEYKYNSRGVSMLNTERLILRPIEVTDYNDICEYGCDEETGRYMLHWPKTEDHIVLFIERCIEIMKSDNITRYEYVMQLKENSKVIGNITLEARDSVAEIGWISNKNYWNNGYMSEAVKEIIKYAFNNLGINTIMATCNDKNIASYKVMEKCYMVRIKTELNHKAYKQGVEITFNRLIYCIEKKNY